MFQLRAVTTTEDDVLVKPIPDGHLDRVLDEAGPDREREPKRLARSVWKLSRELSQERGSGLSCQPEREVIRQLRPVALAVNGPAHCRQGRRMPGTGFDFLQLLLHGLLSRLA